jgi:uncharacterized membrane protein
LASTPLDPTDLSRGNAVLFLTRWVTHFCAPVFCFLAGAGAFLSTFRGKTRPQLARYLLSRGLWLVVLEWTVIQFSWRFGWDGRPFRCQVLWAIGCSMALLASVVLLPPWAVLASGVALIAGNDWLESLLASQTTTTPWVRVVLTSGGSFGLTPGFQFVVSYPILPWFGVMAVGYGLGPLWRLAREPRRRWLLTLGAIMMLLFFVMRATSNAQGQHAWTAQSSSLFTLFSFLNCRKYPPSLLYVLMTLGPALVALAWLDRDSGAWRRYLITFGRVPLFFYLLHLPLLHILARGFAYIWHHGPILPGLVGHSQLALADGSGGWLVLVYLSWMGALLVLYPMCRRFLALKRHREHALFRYL